MHKNQASVSNFIQIYPIYSYCMNYNLQCKVNENYVSNIIIPFTEISKIAMVIQHVFHDTCLNDLKLSGDSSVPRNCVMTSLNNAARIGIDQLDLAQPILIFCRSNHHRNSATIGDELVKRYWKNSIRSVVPYSCQVEWYNCQKIIMFHLYNVNVVKCCKIYQDYWSCDR